MKTYELIIPSWRAAVPAIWGIEVSKRTVIYKIDPATGVREIGADGAEVIDSVQMDEFESVAGTTIHLAAGDQLRSAVDKGVEDAKGSQVLSDMLTHRFVKEIQP